MSLSSAHLAINSQLYTLSKNIPSHNKLKKNFYGFIFSIFIGRNVDFYCTVGLCNPKYPQNKKPLIFLFKREGEVFPFKPLSACRGSVTLCFLGPLPS